VDPIEQILPSQQIEPDDLCRLPAEVAIARPDGIPNPVGIPLGKCRRNLLFDN
jgi:hypothetical protein